MAEMELRPFEEQVTRRRGAVFFWWAVLLLLLTGACFASWLGSFYVISHPEVPKCYKLLKKLKRIEPPKRFALTEAPKGDFLSPGKLLERFGKMGPAQLEKENADLLRAFIMNYREAKRHTIYTTGKFDVVEAYQLGPLDFFPTGVALIAQSVEFPQLVLETLFTAPTKTVPAIKATFPIGMDVTLHRSRDLFALLHVERLPDDRMQFTTIPLPYGGWRTPTKNNQIEFTLRSPEELEKANPKFTLNIDAGLPVIKGDRLNKGLAAYADFRRKALANTTDDQKALAAPELERFEVRVPEVAPEGTGTVVEAIPLPAPRPLPAASANAKMAPPPGPKAVPTPAPAQPLPPRAVVKSPPRPTPAPSIPAPIPGQVGAAPPSVAAVTPSPAPAPGTQAPPPGPTAAAPAPTPAAETRILTPGQASAMVDQFTPAQPTVLTGDFVVTGVLGQRVALRTRDSLRDANADPTKPGTTAALIVVDFPQGVTPPAKDSAFSRDGERGFQVRDVIRGRNGQITIVAAEPRREDPRQSGTRR